MASPVICPKCGAAVAKPGSRFCMTCGAVLAPVEPAAPPPAARQKGPPGWLWPAIGAATLVLVALVAVVVWRGVQAKRSAAATPADTTLPAATVTPPAAFSQTPTLPGDNATTGTYNITQRVALAPSEVLRLGRGAIVQVAYSPDGASLAVATGLGIWIYALDPPDGGRLLTGPEVTSVAWSPDGKQLASGSLDNTVRVWDAASGASLLALEGHTFFVQSVSWSPDGKQLASGSSDKTVRVWDAASGAPLRTIEGHTASVYSVAWSPDGRQLASGSEDGTVRVWDAASGALVRTFEGHAGWVRSVTWSPDGRQLASASDDGTLRVWNTR